MATVRVRVGNDGKRRWQVRYVGSDGREHAQTFHRKTDADRFVSTIETDKLRGNWVNPRLGKITLGRWYQQFTASRIVKPKTAAGYESLMRQHILPALGDRQLRQIKPSDVQAFVAGMQRQGLSASRVRQAYHLLGATLKAAVKDDRLARNPCVGVELPRLTGRKEGHIGAAQLAALAKASGSYRPLILLLGYSGMRWGEAVALRVRSIDFLGGKIRVSESMAEVGGTLHFGSTKTGRSRTVRVPRPVLDLLEEQVTGKGPDNLVFTRSDGGPLRHANFRMRVWLPALRAARLPADMRIHDLRHTCAALLIEQGAHPKVIQEQLGHASITTTLDTYGHLFDDQLDQLAEGMDKTFAEAERTRTRTKSGQGRRLDVVAGQQQLL